MKSVKIHGLVVQSDEQGDQHTHKLFITSWDGRPIHSHEFQGITSIDVGHQHYYAGITQAAASGVQHVHQYHTVTSFDDGHNHIISGITGPAMPIPEGGHYHHFEGYTTVNGSLPHIHFYNGNTGGEV